jgi:hypothetical protein
VLTRQRGHLLQVLGDALARRAGEAQGLEKGEHQVAGAMEDDAARGEHLVGREGAKEAS